MRAMRLRALAVLTTGLLVLSACGDDSTNDDPPGGGDQPTETGDASDSPTGPITATPGELSNVTVEVPEEGSEDAVEFFWSSAPFAEADLPFSVTETEVVEVSEGEGDAAVDGEHLVAVRYALLNGTSGEVALSTFETGEVATFDLTLGTLLPGIAQALEGATPGSQRLAAIPPADAFGPGGGAPELEIGADDTIVLFVEVLEVSAPLTEAEGTEVEPVDGLPTVEFEAPGPAQVTIPEGEDPPTEMVVQLLIEGDGPLTTVGQSVSVHYTGVSWDSGEMFDNSWERGEPFAVAPLGMAGVIDGWNEGLQDLPVGSRVLLVLPPDMAYGDDGHHLAGQTLVFVVDILRAS